ncbi:hypothetical protein LEN26_013316 [Aphanomyces euteiches]|nr:hypothetical protein LEN26_013316 [Aphanomyces euteiches]
MANTIEFVASYPSVDYTALPEDELESFHTADGKLHLFNNIGCPFGHRALWTAIEVNAPFQVVEVSLANKPPSFTEKFNRYGTVPYVLDNGFAVYESAIVAQYLDVKYGEGQLHHVKDVQAASIAQLAAAKFEVRPFFAYLRSGNEEAEKEVKAALDELETIFRVHAKAYRDQGPYLLGAELSSAEINIVPFLYRFDLVLRHFRKHDLLAGHPLINAAFEAVKARPTFQKTVAADEFYIQAFSKFVTPAP